MSAHTKIAANPNRTPKSATDLEKSEIDDKAVRKTVTVENGRKSVLPGPPIPPEVQAELRKEKQSGEARGNERKAPPGRKQQGDKR